MAPEIHLDQLTNASQTDLKKMDIWSLGILAYSMINPNLSNPYRKELSGAPFNIPDSPFPLLKIAVRAALELC